MEVLDFKRDERSRVSFSLRLPRKDWELYLKRASAALQRQRALPGFRPGAAPLKTAEALFGRTLYQAAGTEAQHALLVQFCEERGLDPVSEPSAMVVTADKTGFECVYQFDVYPELTELNYRGLHAGKPHRAVTEADIDREAEIFRRNHLLVRPVERGVRIGDLVELAFRAEKEGYSFSYDRSEQARVIVGQGRLFTGLDEALLGHVAGDELDLELTMAKDFHRDDIAGLTIRVRVRLKSVEERAEQALDDALVSRCVKGCETVADFRERLRQRLAEVYEARAGEIFRRNLEAALAEAVPVAVPDAMIRTNYERYLAGLYAAAQAQKRTIEELLADEGKTLESYQAEMLPLARRQVLFSLAVDYIIEKEGLTVSEAELNAWRRGSAEGMGVSPEKAEELLGGREAVIQELLTKKAMAVVEAAAVPETVEIERLPGEDPALPVLVN